LRLKAIKGWDRLLTWALAPKQRDYPLKKPLEQKKFQVRAKELFQFDQNYGYFSIYHPIVGIVTDSQRDIDVTKCLLESIATQFTNQEQILFSTDEILAKVMAYRSLKKGMKLSLFTWNANGRLVLETFIVDTIIDMWRGMPAFGLVPEKKKASPPILLFRGTDLNLTSEKGWASVLSDLDTTGPGHTTFLRARDQIQIWLKKMKKEQMPARAIGTSLGGVFVLYSLIYESELLSHDPTFPSVAFNAPGISKQILDKWNALKKKPAHITYVNQGDFVSQIGLFLPNVWEIALDHPMQVIEAHTTLISTQPFYQMSAINVPLENKTRE